FFCTRLSVVKRHSVARFPQLRGKQSLVCNVLEKDRFYERRRKKMVLIKASSMIKKMEGGTIATPAGFQVAGMHTGVKRKRNDLGMLYCDVPASAAALYTLNVIQAAPLKVTKESISKERKLQALIVNSGNANACTGKQGEQDAYTMRRAAAEQLSIPEHTVAVSSTGVIGLDMPMNKIIPNIKHLELSTDEK